MSYIISIDPATKTGLALVEFGPSGRPRALATGVTKLPPKARSEWLGRSRVAIEELCAGHCTPGCAIWLIEAWGFHRNFRDAIKLAQIQQTWIDVAALAGAIEPEMMNVTSWQASIGAGKLRAKRDGADARKKHALLYAKSTFGGDWKGYDIADALCMASVWINERRTAG